MKTLVSRTTMELLSEVAKAQHPGFMEEFANLLEKWVSGEEMSATAGFLESFSVVDEKGKSVLLYKIEMSAITEAPEDD